MGSLRGSVDPAEPGRWGRGGRKLEVLAGERSPAHYHIKADAWDGTSPVLK